MTKKRKIIFFTSLPRVGGHSTLTMGLCKFFTQWFEEVEVWCKTMPEHGHSDDTQKALEAMGCRVERISDLQGKLSLGVLGGALVRARQKPPTVFFIMTMRRLSMVLYRLLPKSHSVYYHIAHDPRPETLASLRQYEEFFERLVFICPATYADFGGDPKKCAWAAQPSEMPGLSREALIEERHAGLAESPERVCFGLLGRLTTEKGAEAVLSFIESCTVPSEFHVAGNGPFADRFRALAEREDAHPVVVKFYGAYDPTQRAAFFAKFFSRIDWLIVPSIDEWETLSMVTLEAIQHGVPVLCSNAGGLRSFGMPELGPAPEGVIDLFSPTDLPAELDKRIAGGKIGVEAIDRCREHYGRFFGNSIVAERWAELVQTPRP